MPDDGSLSDALTSKTEVNADTDAATEGALTDGELVRFNARVPANLKRAFADLCDRKATDMTTAIKQYMLRAVKEDRL